MSSIPRDATDRVVANATLELRRRPQHASECVSEVVMGSILRVLERCDQERWLRVLAPDGYRAWVRSWGLVEVRRDWEQPGVFVDCPFDLVLSHPPPRGRPLLPVVLGCRVLLLPRKRGEWQPVMTPDGRAGWLRAASLGSDRVPAASGFWNPPQRGGPSPAAGHFKQASVRRVIGRAVWLRGVPYRWGGASPFGLDCSGLMRLVLGLEGVPMARDAVDQARQLRRCWHEADPMDIRAGDLVFFGDRFSAIDHVGLGLGGGKGRFVHASGRVRSSSLVPGSEDFEGPLLKRYLGVARPPWARSR